MAEERDRLRLDLEQGRRQRGLGAQKATYTLGSRIVVPRPNIRGIPETMVCRILMFTTNHPEVHKLYRVHRERRMALWRIIVHLLQDGCRQRTVDVGGYR